VLAGKRGLEPRFSLSERGILPLDDSPIFYSGSFSGLLIQQRNNSFTKIMSFTSY
jgi:hypothetical protein